MHYMLLARGSNKNVQDQGSGASEGMKLQLVSEDALGVQEAERC